MNWARKSFVHLLAVVLLFALIGMAAAISFNSNLSKPTKLKTWLTESKLYDRSAEAALNQAQTDSGKSGGNLSVSLGDTNVEKAAKQVFTPEMLKQKAEAFIDANYDWLSGKTTKPEFSLDFTQPKLDFADLVGQTVTEHLSALSVCTAEQQAGIQIPVDPLKVQCRPAALEPKTEGERVAQEIKDSSDFLSQPVVTADTLGHDESSQQAPYYENLSALRTAFKLSDKLPPILGILALVCIAGIIFIHPSRRKGIRRIGVTFLLAGIVLLASKFANDLAANKFKESVLTSGTKDSLQQPVADLVQRAESSLMQTNTVLGIVFIVISLVILAYVFITRESNKNAAKKPELKQPYDPQVNTSVDNYSASSPASRPISDTDKITNRMRPPSASLPSQPALGHDTTNRPSGPPPLRGGSRPKPAKPPRLIQ